MRILHLCLACFYIDNYNYQENVLPRIAKEKGHDVKIIASTETYVDNKHLGYVEPCSYITDYGVPIVRLPYRKIINTQISAKLRLYRGLYREICNFKPDIIFSHDLSFSSLPEVIKYVRENSKVCFLSDTHTAYYNSARSWVSLNILHKAIYKYFIKKAVPYLSKYYYISLSEKKFSLEVYNVPEDIMEYMPLGGEIPSDVKKNASYKAIRETFNVAEDELLLVHSGKMDVLKKTIPLLKAFSSNRELKAKMLIIGSFDDLVYNETRDLINSDDRIRYLGWKDSSYLLDCLCACDLYCQPGSPSATLQNAICCGCAVLAAPFEGYKLLDDGNFFWADSESSMDLVFKSIIKDRDMVYRMKEKSVITAKKYLDYEMMEREIRNQYYYKQNI